MDDKYLWILEYNKILDQLAGHTSFSAGRQLAVNLRPSSEEWEVRERLQETTEAKSLLATRTDVTLGGARDVRPLMRRAEVGATLQPTDLLDIRNTLNSGRTLRNVLIHLKDQVPLLAAKAELIDPLADVIQEIGRCLDDDGNVLDDASPALARIRHESAIARDRLYERLRRMVSSSDTARYLQEAIITQRNGRYVIPLKAEFRGRIPGIIHDQSASGATLFIEPLETVDLNNRWHELQLAEQREIERILAELTQMVGRDADVITRDVELLAELDLALAKAQYSYALRGVPAEMSESRWPVADAEQQVPPYEHPLHLIRARHPLLNPATVVPIDVYIGGNYTVLLITGPNTGGKTVSLKTVGLLAAMSQSGLHIPAADGSRLPVFSGIYADIGDEQSIEQSLSTFSSHMSHIIDILRRADSQSLVLLDELGAGTDPVEGSALAQSIIKTLVDRGCIAVSSTHYSQLKVFAFSTPYVQNASVEFDVETLSPTYRLTIGLPGRSNALAIAKRLGLDESILSEAQRLLSPEDLEVDALLANVKSASEAADQAREDAEQRRTRVSAMETELRKKLVGIEEARRQVLEETRAEGRRELEELRETIRRLRRNMAQAVGTTQATQEVAQEVERLLEQMEQPEPVREPVAPPSQKLEVGDKVYVSTLGQTGELLSLSGQEAEVRVGGFRLRAPVGTLEFRSREAPPPPTESKAVRGPLVSSPGVELDLRGQRAEEVAPIVSKYLDDAYLAGLPWVNIIHGKGTGVLKEVVRQFLSDHPLVESYRPGGPGEGGEGVTVVHLAKREQQ
ncbi:MAG: endonuclease MutS2 [Chloroflexi bacterium]|jgi:DNA mismatch repair protein MutS2|nr:endonuclease MutS2 [Chloroflexota bacterium]